MRHILRRHIALATVCLLACAQPAVAPAPAKPVDAAVATDTATDLVAAADLAPLPDTATSTDVAPPTDTTTTAADATDQDTAAPAPDTPAPEVTAPPKPSPWLAIGTFTDISALFEGPFALDTGNKAGNEPASQAAVLFDIDNDKTLDMVIHDGIATVWLYRSLPNKPYKWFKEKVFTEKFNGLKGLAVHQDPGGVVDIVPAGSKLYFFHYDKNTDTWKDESQARGLQAGINVSVQSVQPLDVDQDGLFDLAATVFTCDSKSKLLVFVNQGNGKFVEHADELGLTHAASLWNTLHTDLDGDGHPDLLTLAEDCEPKHGNGYFHNRGHPDTGKRYEIKPFLPVFNAPIHGGGSPMGAAVADWDGNGTIDLFLADIGLREVRRGGADIKNAKAGQLQQWEIGCNRLMLHEKSGAWSQAAAVMGLTNALSDTGLSMVAWSALPLDIDADGHLDLLVTHGYDFGSFLLADEGGMRPVLFRNLGNGKFEDISAAVGMPNPLVGRALAAADLDNDGDLDLLLGGQSMQPKLLRNDIKRPGHALNVQLKGTTSNPWGLGARLQLVTDKRQLAAEISVQSVAHGMATPVAHFSFPDGDAIVGLQIAWPSGFVQQLQAVNWPIDLAPLVVVEPEVAKISERFLMSIPNVGVTITAKNFAPDGTPKPAQGLTIELGAGDPGSFTGPTVCDPVACTRQWVVPTGQNGEASFVIAAQGKPWLVRPRVRFLAAGG